MATLFVSDVHIGPANPSAASTFEDFVDALASRIDALYILGDLFDAWVGDDDQRPPHPRIIAALARLTASGIPVGALHGNHDFLLGDAFAEATGCTLYADPDIITLYGERVAICHGDHLCTDDVEYQAWRTYSRTPDHQRVFLTLPMEDRLAQAAALKAKSKQAAQLKPDDIMDVNQDAVVKAFTDLGVNTLIHGHTHRPALHEFHLDGMPARRFVLGDWYEQSHVLVWTPDGARAMSAAEAVRTLG